MANSSLRLFLLHAFFRFLCYPFPIPYRFPRWWIRPLVSECAFQMLRKAKNVVVVFRRSLAVPHNFAPTAPAYLDVQATTQMVSHLLVSPGDTRGRGILLLMGDGRSLVFAASSAVLIRIIII